MKTILQHVILPSLRFNAQEEMYTRMYNDRTRISLSKSRLLMETGGYATFDTFFNAFTVHRWKSNTDIKDLSLTLIGTGKIRVRLGLHAFGKSNQWLDESDIVLDPENGTEIAVESWNKLRAGLLYFTVEALGPTEITSGFYSTQTAPAKNPKLGIVITHFNRKEYVVPAIKRIKQELLNNIEARNRFELIVVDNSKTITEDEAQGITLIPNMNFGGSGGFTRGLLHLKESGDFTHCLFMDDDASCEIESIRRAYSYISYNQNPDIAIAGSLLREIEPNRLFEKGARFEGYCTPLKSGFDMLRVPDLIAAEIEDFKANYGAWWFFCFPIHAVIKYPFPFFVRGDDIRFSLDNKFPIATMNGIACWGEDFALKSGPMPQYLDLRHTLVNTLTKTSKNRFEIAAIALRFFIMQILSYNYASAKAVLEAMRDYIRGPSTFTDDMDASIARRKIAAFGTGEKMQPINRSEYKFDYPTVHESQHRRMIRKITLNGILAPFLVRKGTVFQHKKFHGEPKEIFGYKKVIYVYEPENIGYIAEFSPKESLLLMIKGAALIISCITRHRKIKSLYEKALPKLTSEAFWQDIYSNSKIQDN